MLVNSMLIHCYLPLKFMSTIIVPIVKDNKGNLSSCENYRPVAITSVYSKVLELIILSCHSEYFNSSCYRFGFKPKHGTEECIFVLKSVIDFYQS